MAFVVALVSFLALQTASALLSQPWVDTRTGEIHLDGDNEPHLRTSTHKNLKKHHGHHNDPRDAHARRGTDGHHSDVVKDALKASFHQGAHAMKYLAKKYYDAHHEHGKGESQAHHEHAEAEESGDDHVTEKYGSTDSDQKEKETAVPEKAAPAMGLIATERAPAAEEVSDSKADGGDAISETSDAKVDPKKVVPKWIEDFFCTAMERYAHNGTAMPEWFEKEAKDIVFPSGGDLTPPAGRLASKALRNCMAMNMKLALSRGFTVPPFLKKKALTVISEWEHARKEEDARARKFEADQQALAELEAANKARMAAVEAEEKARIERAHARMQEEQAEQARKQEEEARMQEAAEEVEAEAEAAEDAIRSYVEYQALPPEVKAARKAEEQKKFLEERAARVEANRLKKEQENKELMEKRARRAEEKKLEQQKRGH